MTYKDLPLFSRFFITSPDDGTTTKPTAMIKTPACIPLSHYIEDIGIVARAGEGEETANYLAHQIDRAANAFQLDDGVAVRVRDGQEVIILP